MIPNKRNYLISEINELNNLISISSGNKWERLSLAKRLEQVKEELDSLPVDVISPRERFILTFRGEPVVGSSAINADFGSKALAYFSDLFSVIVAGLSGSIKAKGPIPNKFASTPMVVDIARGSFGFELELPEITDVTDELTGIDNNKSEIIMGKIFNIFESPVYGTDDDLADMVGEIHERGLVKLRHFLNFLNNHNAYIGMKYKDKKIQYANKESVLLAIDRVGQNNVSEGYEAFTGEFLGILPESRMFELKLSDGNIIGGRIGRIAGSLDNKIPIHTSYDVKLNFTKVGQGKKRYTLTNLDFLESYQ